MQPSRRSIPGSPRSARAAYNRIKQVLAAAPARHETMALPVPEGTREVENLVYAYPGASEPILCALNFRAEPGESLGIIGPTAAGKTTLARTDIRALDYLLEPLMKSFDRAFRES